MDFGTYQPATKSYLLTATKQTLVYGVEVAFIFLASASAGYLSNFSGRKVGLYLCAVCSIVGACLQMIPHLAALVVGRAVMGASIGYAAVYCIAYWSEIATPAMRGKVVIFYQFSLNIANFIGSCIDQGTHKLTTPWAYRGPLLTMLLPPLLLIALVWMIPESPRWLVAHGRNEQAHINLTQIRGPTYSQEEVKAEIDETIKFTCLEEELHSSATYLDCFRGTDLRRTLLTILVMVGQQCMGVAFLAGFVSNTSPMPSTETLF